MIAPPKENSDRALLRAFLEAGAQFFPVTAALTRLYQTSHPSQFQRELEQWRTDVSDAANRLAARLDALEQAHHPTLTLSEDADTLARWLVATSERGLEEFVEAEAVLAALPDWTVRRLQDVAAELKLAGLATTSATLGHPVRLVTPTAMLFALFDPVVVGASPQTDAVELARLILELDPSQVSSAEFAGRLGWEPRRFNPALSLLLTLVPDRQVRKVLQPTWVTAGFIVSAETRVQLRRLVSSAGG